MNSELHKQFQLARDKSKDDIKKSGISSNNLSVGISPTEIVEACRNLQEILKQRNEKDKT